MLYELTDDQRATIVAALADMQEAYRLSGYSKADMDDIELALAVLRTPVQLAQERYSHRNGETDLPAEDGKYLYKGLRISGNTGYGDPDGWMLDVRIKHGGWVHLGADMWPLCEFTGRWWGPIPLPWEQPQPVMPEPSWADAPEWAQYWAMDESGFAYWYGREPSEGISQWNGGGVVASDGKERYEHWRTTLRRRPPAE